MPRFKQNAPSTFQNFIYDLSEDFLFGALGTEDDIFWENREQYETYHLVLSCTIILAFWKWKGYAQSRKLKDHRGKWWLKGEKPTV